MHFPVEGLDLSRIMAVDNAVGANGEEALSEKDEVVSNGKATQSPELTSDGEKDSAEDDTATVTSSTEEDSAGPSINQDSGRSEMLYDLYGVVHHQGAISTGHYVASLKSDIDGQWRLFNDAQIFEIHSRDVVDSSAYILFYIRRDAKNLKLSDFWNIDRREGEGLTEEEMNELIRGRSDRCVIS